MWCCFCPRAQRTLETGSVEYLIDPPSCLSTLLPPQVRRSDCRDMVNPGILTCLPRFPGLPVGPRCPAIPGSPFGPISPWKEKKRSKRGIRACGAGRSLQVYPVTGHEGSLLDHSKSFPGGLLWNWKSDVRACERWVVFFSWKRRERRRLPRVGDLLSERDSCRATHILVSQITIQNGPRGSCFSVACVPVTTAGCWGKMLPLLLEILVYLLLLLLLF